MCEWRLLGLDAGDHTLLMVCFGQMCSSAKKVKNKIKKINRKKHTQRRKKCNFLFFYQGQCIAKVQLQNDFPTIVCCLFVIWWYCGLLCFLFSFCFPSLFHLTAPENNSLDSVLDFVSNTNVKRKKNSPSSFWTQWKCDVYMYRLLKFSLLLSGLLWFDLFRLSHSLQLLSPLYDRSLLFNLNLIPCSLKGNGTISV